MFQRYFFLAIMVGFVEPGYTFGESQGVGMIGVMKSEVSNVPFSVRVRGGGWLTITLCHSNECDVCTLLSQVPVHLHP